MKYIFDNSIQTQWNDGVRITVGIEIIHDTFSLWNNMGSWAEHEYATYFVVPISPSFLASADSHPPCVA